MCLTESEQKVYDSLVSTGKTNRELAKMLNFDRRTIEKYLERIYLKFGVTSARELIVKHYGGNNEDE